MRCYRGDRVSPAWGESEGLAEETEDGVILRTVAQSIAHVQALARQYSGGKAEASIDAFLARRGEESDDTIVAWT